MADDNSIGSSIEMRDSAAELPPRSTPAGAHQQSHRQCERLRQRNEPRVLAVGGRRQAVRRRAEIAGAAAVQHGGHGGVPAAGAAALLAGSTSCFAGLFGGGGSGKFRGRHGRDQAVRGRWRDRYADLFPAALRRAGLAGEAGPEAIVPLARGPDGRLGVAIERRRRGQVTIHIATPDLESFRRSENYLTGQIARAVARGQRVL